MHWNGLTWKSVTWAFTDPQPYYHPLPRLSHVLDYEIWGTDPSGHHAVNVFLHALNAVLVFSFLWTLLGRTPLTAGERLAVAWWIAAVFAIHPMQTESVAWTAGRTQLMCTTFGISCLWAYTAGARRWIVWILFAAALLCKPMAVSLPFVILAIDYFPLRRYERSGWRQLVREKAVMIVLAVGASVAAVITQSQAGDPLAPMAAIPLPARVLRMFESLTFYASKLFWPSHLSPTYPTDLPLGRWSAAVSVLVVIVITAAAVVERRRLPMLAAGWGAYLVLILPVSGLMWTGVSVAIRYEYVAMLPLLLLAAGAVLWLWRRSPKLAQAMIICLLAGQLCAFASHARSLIPDWRDDETLRRAELAGFPDSAEANRALATELLDQGRAGEALPFAQRAVALAPQTWEAHMRLGLVLIGLERFQDAVGQFEHALRLNPYSAGARFGWGVALEQLGKPDEAVQQYMQAVQLDPDLAEAHNNLGNILSARGRTTEAIAQYQEALRIKPDYAQAHNNLGANLMEQGSRSEAIAQYREALQIDPDLAEARKNLGDALAQPANAPTTSNH
jgi:Flp pilus assembly protein TadD